MPFTRTPTLAMRPTEKPRPRRAETTSPPKRSNTRKVNVVSKASLAMLNPAYAMGIEAGPSWYEEEGKRSAEERAGRGQLWLSEGHSPTMSPTEFTSQMQQSSSWNSDLTPELEAFLLSGDAEYSLQSSDAEEVGSDVSSRGGALGVRFDSTSMQRKASNESVFEDDEQIASSRKKSSTTTASGSSSSLSKFFSWKRPTKGKNYLSSSSTWEVPSSAPPYIQTFQQAASYSSNAGVGTSSMPTTPIDAFANVALPSPSTIAPKIVSRKSSMPTLRDIRRAAGSPLAQDVPLPDISTTASSFYWRAEAPITPTTGCSTPVLGGTPSKASRSNSRISSVGRGAARKSTVDILMPAAPKSPKKKKRYDQWNSSTMPPLPISPSSSQSSLYQTDMLPSTNSEGDMSSSSLRENVIQTRRRSKSVDTARPSISMFGPPPMFSSEVHGMDRYDLGDVEEEGMHQAVRINLNNRNVVGVSSPKLLVRPSFAGSEKKNSFLQVIQPPIVVNVMPPTPDLNAEEQETFDGEVAVQDQDCIANEYTQQHQGFFTEEAEEEEYNVPELDTDDESVLPYVSGDRDVTALHRRSQSTISDLSDFTTSAFSEATDGMDEPFGFTRSLSSMSLSSESSVESDFSEEGAAIVQNATIMSASSTMSSFSRAQFVSPRHGEFSNWSRSNSSADTSLTSLPSTQSFHDEKRTSRIDSRRSSRRNSRDRMSDMPSLSSGESLASLMSASTGSSSSSNNNNFDMAFEQAAIRTFGKGETYNLSSPVELQGQMEESDCDTPRLSGMARFNTTKPLIVRKINANGSQSCEEEQKQQQTFSPISPRPYPRAHNADSPHLELDLSLPLDLHEIGLGFEFDHPPKSKGRPSVPSKSRARKGTISNTGEPQTPPSTTRLLSNVMKQDFEKEAFGLGLGLGLDSAHPIVMSNGHSTSNSLLGLAI